jgi:hypothetical protein
MRTNVAFGVGHVVDHFVRKIFAVVLEPNLVAADLE